MRRPILRLGSSGTGAEVGRDHAQDGRSSCPERDDAITDSFHPVVTHSVLSSCMVASSKGICTPRWQLPIDESTLNFHLPTCGSARPVSRAPDLNGGMIHTIACKCLLSPWATGSRSRFLGA